MRDRVVAWLRGEWENWLQVPLPELRTAILSGGPAHPNRYGLFVFASNDSFPTLFVKVALDRDERDHLEREAAAVNSIGARAGSSSALTLPKVFGQVADSEHYAAAYAVMPGRRLLVPQLLARSGRLGKTSMIRFWQDTAECSAHLRAISSDSPEADQHLLADRVGTFLRHFELSSSVRSSLESLQAQLSDSPFRWTPSWQHGDIAVGNVLVHGGQLLLIDWEAARPDYEPWYDVATAPVAAVVLACRQSRRTPTEVASNLLSPTYWVGSAMSRVIGDMWRWPLPVGWAVTLVAMNMALRLPNLESDMTSEYADLVRVLFSDPAFRSSRHWLAI